MIIIITPLIQFDIIAWMLYQHFIDKKQDVKVIKTYNNEDGMYILLGHQYYFEIYHSLKM